MWVAGLGRVRPLGRTLRCFIPTASPPQKECRTRRRLGRVNDEGQVRRCM
jgi:hypothetical protein